MASEYLFGNNIRPLCRHCEHMIQVLRDDALLCDKHGMVAKDHKCRHFVYDPLKRVPRKPKPLEKYENAEFEL